jgi:hypothetical protein
VQKDQADLLQYKKQFGNRPSPSPSTDSPSPADKGKAKEAVQDPPEDLLKLWGPQLGHVSTTAAEFIDYCSTQRKPGFDTLRTADKATVESLLSNLFVRTMTCILGEADDGKFSMHHKQLAACCLSSLLLNQNMNSAQLHDDETLAGLLEVISRCDEESQVICSLAVSKSIESILHGNKDDPQYVVPCIVLKPLARVIQSAPSGGGIQLGFAVKTLCSLSSHLKLQERLLQAEYWRHLMGNIGKSFPSEQSLFFLSAIESLTFNIEAAEFGKQVQPFDVQQLLMCYERQGEISSPGNQEVARLAITRTLANLCALDKLTSGKLQVASSVRESGQSGLRILHDMLNSNDIAANAIESLLDFVSLLADGASQTGSDLCQLGFIGSLLVLIKHGNGTIQYKALFALKALASTEEEACIKFDDESCTALVGLAKPGNKTSTLETLCLLTHILLASSRKAEIARQMMDAGALRNFSSLVSGSGPKIKPKAAEVVLSLLAAVQQLDSSSPEHFDSAILQPAFVAVAHFVCQAGSACSSPTADQKKYRDSQVQDDEWLEKLLETRGIRIVSLVERLSQYQEANELFWNLMLNRNEVLGPRIKNSVFTSIMDMYSQDQAVVRFCAKIIASCTMPSRAQSFLRREGQAIAKFSKVAQAEDQHYLLEFITKAQHPDTAGLCLNLLSGLCSSPSDGVKQEAAKQVITAVASTAMDEKVSAISRTIGFLCAAARAVVHLGIDSPRMSDALSRVLEPCTGLSNQELSSIAKPGMIDLLIAMPHGIAKEQLKLFVLQQCGSNPEFQDSALRGDIEWLIELLQGGLCGDDVHKFLMELPNAPVLQTWKHHPVSNPKWIRGIDHLGRTVYTDLRGRKELLRPADFEDETSTCEGVCASFCRIIQEHPELQEPVTCILLELARDVQTVRFWYKVDLNRSVEEAIHGARSAGEVLDLMESKSICQPTRMSRLFCSTSGVELSFVDGAVRGLKNGRVDSVRATSAVSLAEAGEHQWCIVVNDLPPGSVLHIGWVAEKAGPEWFSTGTGLRDKQLAFGLVNAEGKTSPTVVYDGKMQPYGVQLQSNDTVHCHLHVTADSALRFAFRINDKQHQWKETRVAGAKELYPALALSAGCCVQAKSFDIGRK